MSLRLISAFSLVFAVTSTAISRPATAAVPSPDETVTCDIFVAGGGLAGAAAAYEGLLAGKTVCVTEITDWLGGQISSQGTSALDERPTQREQFFFPQGYLELRERIEDYYGELNPGDCWVSLSCFFPDDAHSMLQSQLEDAEREGQGTLKWFPSTVVKDLDLNADGTLMERVIGIQHEPTDDAPPLNTYHLSETIEDWYQYEDSDQFKKTIIEFMPQDDDWYVIDATETGELVGLADVPYRLGLDPRSHLEPSSVTESGDRYCTQGFTYTFAMEATEEPQDHPEPDFYAQYEPYYSYELERLASFDLVFTYRRLWSPETGEQDRFGGIGFTKPTPGDISMQNWTWGNDYRPGTAEDNFIYTREQLEESGQLSPGGWMGGLRTETLRRGEEHALGYFHWLVAGTTDSQLGDEFKEPHPNNRFLSGLDSPMGTEHGLSKYPYIREGRRIIGREGEGYPDGFTIWEVDITRNDLTDEYYQETLSDSEYQWLKQELAGTEAIAAMLGEDTDQRARSRIYPDSVGIGHYAIDFHPCMTEHPPEKPGNTEREGTRRAEGQAYPFQIPLRALIPQDIDNFLIAGKSIATSNIAAAAYRVHSFEWSVGAAAGTTAAFALEEDVYPYELVDGRFYSNEQLQGLKRRLEDNGNPTAFPDTSIFNNDWDDWR
ncbi:FAD-dependent oxidoreductase [Euhalothece natronophila Z-M001]|uniref:FAD-dependent oxidoreductase n=1 Tax=Euhalothece natronophila Z-M001 TaxID=522448 RepID=A0A5B8NJ77_9CHRO|nr:FAD-dependent oxidoreductase [Euhalothece natronophila]QDZ39034.1 FAD-dependent oxidoreductase [Euhalothece natronophila Z-M001]